MDLIQILIILGAVVALFLLLGVAAACYRRVGPNEALIVYGRPVALRDEHGEVRRIGFRIVSGGGAVVWPVIEQAKVLSLEAMPLDVSGTEVYDSQGEEAVVFGTAVVNVRNDYASIAAAAQLFLSKTGTERNEVLRPLLEGHVRAVAIAMTLGEIHRHRDVFAQRVIEASTVGFSEMGLAVLGFTVSEVQPHKSSSIRTGEVPAMADVRWDATAAATEPGQNP